jgi:hypothetical protein
MLIHLRGGGLRCQQLRSWRRPAPLLLRALQMTPEPADQHRWPLVDRLNSTLATYPMTSFTVYTATSLGTFGVAFGLLRAVDFDVPALALGGLVARLSKKPRAPLDLALAATVAHAVPATNALKLGPLLAPMQAQKQPDADSTPLERKVHSAIAWAEGPVNRYGAPYMLVHWASGLLTVGVATTCVNGGVDVVALISHLPLMSDAANVQLVTGSASCMAGAACINSLTLPARLLIFASYGGWFCAEVDRRRTRWSSAFLGWYRRYLRDNPDAKRNFRLYPRRS